MFVDRVAELAQLEELYRSDQAELFVLYGRRRVGKTELLRAFCAGKPNIFFIATLGSDSDQLAAFSQALWRFDHGTTLEGFTLPTWEAAFKALAGLPGRPIVVLDEFTYLVSGNKAIPSILQKVWDESLRATPLMLILCGSYIGMMEHKLLGYRAPLYGRRTGGYLLRPLVLSAAGAFFTAYTPIQQIEMWAVLGGIPYYLSICSDSVDVLANIQRHILAPKGVLYHEPHLLLLEELREPRNYFSILRAIAQGDTRLNDIALAAGLASGPAAASYLDTLQQMQIVRRSVPATESQPEKSRKGIYRIADPFLRFWFRYVHPYRSSLELGLTEAIMEQRVRPTFDQFVSYAFEDAAREHVACLARVGKLPFLPERIGAWWDQSEEIDVVAVSDAEDAALVGECKWSARPIGVSVLVDLKRKAQIMNASGRWRQVTYLIFAKTGFTAELETVAASEGVRLVQAAELTQPPAAD
jgi:AAA+ ATPase superfamily predicted ATPase